MPFPQTESELKEAGYEYQNSGKCKSCRAEIAWYLTPAGKYIPLDEGTLVPHWSTCPRANEHRKRA